MAGRPQGIHNSQSAITYVNKRGINELFEAIMTGLMVNKPDDHIAFIRECLDKVPSHTSRVRWDLFVPNASNTKGALPSRPMLAKTRPKALPPVRNSNPTPRTTYQSSVHRAPAKSVALPPIENNNKKNDSNQPIVFILSSSSSTTLCSRLIERYNQITYLYINDIANIDNDDDIDLKKHEHRYESIQRHIERARSNTQGFLIAGQINEKNFCKQWQEKLGRIELIILLSSDRQTVFNQNQQILQINSNNDFDTIFNNTIRTLDNIFSQNMLRTKSNHLNLPIIFCIDNHRLPIKSNGNQLVEHVSIDEEFDRKSEGAEEQINNSFIYMLSERIAEQFSFKHIHYEDSNENLRDFDQMKTLIIESMSTSVGFIIDEFPTSFEDLRKFQTEIGPCSVLIYIGEHQTVTKDDELNGIVEKFKEQNKAIYIDCRMEVDEVYEDLKNEILKHI